MVELNKETNDILGGGIFIGIGIIGFVSFVIGIFDGYTRPLKCR